MSLTVRDVIKKQEGRQQRRHEAFEAVLDQCNRRIAQYVEVLKNTRACVFEVPDVAIGFPLYNLNDCIGYVKSSLVANGFSVEYIFPRFLVIHWDPPNVSGTPQPKPSKQSKPSSKKTQKGRVATSAPAFATSAPAFATSAPGSLNLF
ncbi:hypothetical protein FOA52_004154 [Chlamydomonas sp. UWO 241]|nr:hypothetical protein FOA52_004154 [Chlamydomonas sp. UWO 241]